MSDGRAFLPQPKSDGTIAFEGADGTTIHSEGIFPSTITRNGAGDYTIDLREDYDQLEGFPCVSFAASAPRAYALQFVNNQQWRIRTNDEDGNPANTPTIICIVDYARRDQ